VFKDNTANNDAQDQDKGGGDEDGNGFLGESHSDEANGGTSSFS
jgi:hypothetical protein